MPPGMPGHVVQDLLVAGNSCHALTLNPERSCYICVAGRVGGVAGFIEPQQKCSCKDIAGAGRIYFVCWARRNRDNFNL